MAKPVIISCAITGSLHVPSMSPHLPLTPDEIAFESLAAAEAGAAILHLHARDPIDGRPTADPDVFRRLFDDFLDELVAAAHRLAEIVAAQVFQIAT